MSPTLQAPSLICMWAHNADMPEDLWKEVEQEYRTTRGITTMSVCIVFLLAIVALGYLLFGYYASAITCAAGAFVAFIFSRWEPMEVPPEMIEDVVKLGLEESKGDDDGKSADASVE